MCCGVQALQHVAQLLLLAGLERGAALELQQGLLGRGQIARAGERERELEQGGGVIWAQQQGGFEPSERLKVALGVVELGA